MLDKLPLELVQQIIRLALPSSYSSLTYRQCQDTLLSLCRTSTALAALAQPILFEFVELTSEGNVDSFLEEANGPGKGSSVKVVRIDVQYGWRRKCSGMEEFLCELSAWCQNVVELRVQWEEVDLSCLTAFANLRGFLIYGGMLTASGPFSLDKLEEFSATHFELGGQTRYYLSPASYPRLRNLHMELCRDRLPDGVTFLPFIAHVDTFSCDNTDFEPTDTASVIVPTMDVVLLLVDLQELAGTGPLKDVLKQAKHLRVNKYPYALRDGEDSSADDPDYGIRALARLASQLRLPGSHYLSTLFLPSEYDPSSPSLFLNAPQRTHMIAFRSTCISLSVDVVFEESPHPYLESGVSPEFARRCRAAKAKEEEEERLAKGR